MSYYTGFDNKQYEIDWDLVFLNKNKNINGKYILSIVEYHNCIDNYFEFYFLLDKCIDLVHKFGIYKTFSMIAVYHSDIITFQQLKKNNKLYIHLAKLLLQHFSSFDIIANICNGGYIPIDTFDDDTISNASTEIEDLNDTDNDNDNDTETDNDNDTESSNDTDTESSSDYKTESSSDNDTESSNDTDTDNDNDTDTESSSDNDTESSTDYKTESSNDTDTESSSDYKTESSSDNDTDTESSSDNDTDTESSNDTETESSNDTDTESSSDNDYKN